MSVKELFQSAIEYKQDDLQALIMFLVFEKQVLTMEDSKKELELYYLPKHEERMGKELTAFKRKIKMKNRPSFYKVFTHQGTTIYISAMNETQATRFTLSLNYDPIEMMIVPDDYLMAVNGSVKKIADVLKDEYVPVLLGENNIEQKYNWRNLP